MSVQKLTTNALKQHPRVFANFTLIFFADITQIKRLFRKPSLVPFKLHDNLSENLFIRIVKSAGDTTIVTDL